MNRIDCFQDADGNHLFLSNFFPSKTHVFGKEWPTVEHAYQAMKTLDPGDQTRIRLCTTPGKAKRMGRSVEMRHDWEDVKIAIMDECLKAKFDSPALAQRLLDTGDAILVEGNTWNDTFWGVCNGKGANWLGRLLMLRRSHIQLTWQGELL